jgi:mRNA-degrading endonuclease toxin of MazEF toxin-antitoxin module
MKRGEIWLVSLDPTSGHEQKGRRPVLIVSPEAFNRITKLPVILPITSGGNFARTAGFAVALTGTGTKTTAFQTRSWTRCWRGYRQYLSERPHAVHRLSKYLS